MSACTSRIPLHRRFPRGTAWLVIAAILLVAIALTAPIQLPVVLYKLSLISLAAVVGYWIDRSLFPYSRPDGYLYRNWRYGTDEPEGDVDYPIVSAYQLVFAIALIRRAMIVGAVMIGVALGL
jgi:hypothetical protein